MRGWVLAASADAAIHPCRRPALWHGQGLPSKNERNKSESRNVCIPAPVPAHALYTNPGATGPPSRAQAACQERRKQNCSGRRRLNTHKSTKLHCCRARCAATYTLVTPAHLLAALCRHAHIHPRPSSQSHTGHCPLFLQSTSPLLQPACPTACSHARQVHPLR